MDKNLAAFLDPTAYTVEVEYFSSKNSAEVRHYLFVTNIPGIKKGDLVIVNSRVSTRATPIRREVDSSIQHMDDILIPDVEEVTRFFGSMDVVKVVDVHASVDIEPNDPKTYSWVVQKVDMAAWTATQERNARLVSLTQEAYKRNLRKSYAERILGDLSDEERSKLQALLPSK